MCYRLPPRPIGFRAPPRTVAPPPATLTLNTYNGAVHTVAQARAGTTYTVTVQGTYTDWNEPLAVGAPEPDAMYPATPANVTRHSHQAGIDAETLFACPTDHKHPLGHWPQFQVSTDGTTWSHVEPVGGPYATPQTGHLYTYHLVGQGVPFGFRLADTPQADNYGALKINVTEL